MDKTLNHNKHLSSQIYTTLINHILKKSMPLMSIHTYTNKYRYSNISVTTPYRYFPQKPILINKGFGSHLRIEEFYILSLLKRKTHFTATATSSLICKTLIVFSMVFYMQGEANNFIITSKKSNF